MYLIVLYILAVLNIDYSSSSCGCEINRNQKCTTDHSTYNKYSKESNEIPEDNNLEANESNLKTPFKTVDMVLIKDGTFEMGTNQPIFQTDNESPARNVTVNAFYIDKYEVSNKDFKEFILSSGYKTEAEVFGDSFIFDLFLPDNQKDQYANFRAVQAPWWVKAKGVDWKHPEGPETTIDGLLIFILYHNKSIDIF